MAWFKYLDLDGVEVYPNLRKKITFPIPKEDVVKDAWLFVDTLNLRLDTFYTLVENNGQFEKDDIIEPDSYLVVYEDISSASNSFTPVTTQVVGNLVYFKAAENHLKDIKISKQYSLYYKTKNLKLIKKNTPSGIYQECLEADAEFVSSDEDVNTSSYERNPSSLGYYNFSFPNANSEWSNGLSLKAGASLIGTFTGPNFSLYCDKGPSYGRLQIKISSYGSDIQSDNATEIDWQDIDLYNQTELKNVVVFSRTNLFYKKYVFEIVSNFEKNLLSSDGKVNIKKYTFTLDNSLNLQKEEISSTLLGRVVSRSG